MNNKTRYRLSIILCVFVLAISNSAKAKMVKTHSVKSVLMQSISEWVDKDTIVFIDVDDTLMAPKSQMFLHKTNPFRSFIDNMITRGKKTNHYNVTVAKWYQQRQVKSIEDGWPDYIEELKSKGAAVYGMCKMPLHLVNIGEKRYLEAKELGIVFTDQVNGQDIFEIKKQREWFSSFYKGIIFTGPYTRSHILLEFLKVTNNVPKKILFISNIKPELERVEKKLRALNTQFYNVIYLAIKNMPGRPDPELIRFQQQQLLHNGIWMEDEEAKLSLEQQKTIQANQEAVK